MSGSRAGSGAWRKKGTGTSDPGMIGYTLPEIRRLLISLIQRYSPDPTRSGRGPPGTENASTKPGYATTGNADIYSPKCRRSIRHLNLASLGVSRWGRAGLCVSIPSD